MRAANLPGMLLGAVDIVPWRFEGRASCRGPRCEAIARYVVKASAAVLAARLLTGPAAVPRFPKSYVQAQGATLEIAVPNNPLISIDVGYLDLLEVEDGTFDEIRLEVGTIAVGLSIADGLLAAHALVEALSHYVWDAPISSEHVLEIALRRASALEAELARGDSSIPLSRSRALRYGDHNVTVVGQELRFGEHTVPIMEAQRLAANSELITFPDGCMIQAAIALLPVGVAQRSLTEDIEALQRRIRAWRDAPVR